MSCLRASTRLAGRRAGLSEAERLWLEEHLQGCGSCRADAHALDAMTALVHEASEATIGERGLSRALASALREGGAQTVAAPSAGPLRRIVLSLSLGSALVAAGLLLWFGVGPGRAPQDLGAAWQAAVPALAPAAPAEPSVVPPGQPVRLAHAQVLLDEDGAAAWDAAAATVTLRSGRVSVQVDKAPHRRFRVATERFLVEVVGTRFEVTPEGVEVHEGTVRVLAPDGTPLVVALSAGGRWQVKQTVASGGAPRAAAPRVAPVRPEAAPLLAEARRQLADGDARSARRLVDDALDAKPSRRERAEAETLLAEADLVDGHKTEAGNRYARVAGRYADLPAGENALFAATSLAAREGRDAVARKLAKRYLKRYPRGRFIADVRALVERLPQ